jgi:hypothetical protein
VTAIISKHTIILQGGLSPGLSTVTKIPHADHLKISSMMLHPTPDAALGERVGALSRPRSCSSIADPAMA